MSEQLHWRCISGCGSCCRLDPGERNEALEALSAEQQQQYLEMVGPDGWCIHYDTGSSSCRIYDERPMFCRVENLAQLFEVPAEEANDFAIACCRQQIRCEHGGRDRKSTRLNSSHSQQSRMPSSA